MAGSGPPNQQTTTHIIHTATLHY
jgi:hypothetical protein